MAAGAGGRPLLSAVQSQSPGGLAHSAISALRRGELPVPEAQASLDSTIEWRAAWDQWFDAAAPLHTALSQAQGAAREAAEARGRAGAARRCLGQLGGPLEGLDEPEAAKRLRGAYAQHAGLAGAEAQDWRYHLDTLRNRIALQVRFDEPLSPSGLLIGDLDRAAAEDRSLPAEPLIASWIRFDGTDGLRRAARRWATAAAAPVFDAERAAARKEADAAAELHSAAPVATVGREAADRILSAAEAADSPGVRLHPHQRQAVERFARMLADAAPSASR